MLFDDDYNLVGVIDWSNAQSAPLEQLSVFPEFATAPGLSEEQNRPMVELKELVVKALQELKREELEKRQDITVPLDRNTSVAPVTRHKTQLSEYMASKMSEIAFRQHMSSPGSYLWDGKTIAKFVYGSTVT